MLNTLLTDYRDLNDMLFAILDCSMFLIIMYTYSSHLEPPSALELQVTHKPLSTHPEPSLLIYSHCPFNAIPCAMRRSYCYFENATQDSANASVVIIAM